VEINMTDWLQTELDRPYHAAAQLFPLLEGADFDQLKADIAEHGLLEPITLHPDGSILDGRNRHRACVAAGIQPYFHTWNADGSPTDFVLSMNLHRRHLTTEQKILLGEKLEPIYAAEAEEERRRKISEYQTTGQTAEKVPPSKTEQESAQKAAKAAGTNAHYIRDMKRLRMEAPDLAEQIESGKLTMAKAKKVLKERKRKEERAAMAQAVQNIQPSDRWQVYHDDMTTWTAPRQYDFIITDPPYPREYLPLYETLAHRALEWLRPGGLLVAMCGQSYLDEIMTMMTAHLDYYWTAAYLTPGQPTPLRQRQVNTTWKPLLMFTRKGDAYRGKIFGDVFVSDAPEKGPHDWGQSVSGMAAVVTQVCLPGQWILDPFCGGGSTGIASLMHSCLFHGVEIDEANVNISRRRLSEHDQATI
jgi:hypothetical protein